VRYLKISPRAPPAPLGMTESFCAPSYPVIWYSPRRVSPKFLLPIHAPAIDHLHFALVQLNNLTAMEFAFPQKGKTA